jgi:hypothetical protein
MMALPVAPVSTLSSSSRDSCASASEERCTSLARASGYTASAIPINMTSSRVAEASGWRLWPWTSAA